jgi:hypothetical protein
VQRIVDDHSRHCPGQIVGLSISDARMAGLFDDLALRDDVPAEIVLDTASKKTRRTMFDWSDGKHADALDPPKTDESRSARHGNSIGIGFRAGRLRADRGSTC